jgi:hypothetical protein
MYKSLLAAPTSWDYAGPLYLTDKENQDESDWTRHSKPPFTKQAYESAAAAVAYPEDRYIAWNWDDPGYCKQQASLLGF